VLWVSSPEGLYVADLKAQDASNLHFQLVTHQPYDPNSMPGNYTNCVYSDRADIVWVGSPIGLLKYDSTLCFPQTVAHVTDSIKSLGGKVGRF